MSLVHSETMWLWSGGSDSFVLIRCSDTTSFLSISRRLLMMAADTPRHIRLDTWSTMSDTKGEITTTTLRAVPITRPNFMCGLSECDLEVFTSINCIFWNKCHVYSIYGAIVNNVVQASFPRPKKLKRSLVRWGCFDNLVHQARAYVLYWWQ